jgi:hypothetical protein
VKESRTPGLFQVNLNVKNGFAPAALVDAASGTNVQLNVGGKCFFGHPTKLILY